MPAPWQAAPEGPQAPLPCERAMPAPWQGLASALTLALLVGARVPRLAPGP